IVVKGLAYLGTFEIREAGNIVFLRCLLAHQEALNRAVLDDRPDNRSVLLEVLGQLCVVEREPATGPEVWARVTRHGLVEDRIRENLGLFKVIAQVLEHYVENGQYRFRRLPGWQGRFDRCS